MKEILFTDFHKCLREDEVPLTFYIDDVFLQEDCSRKIVESASGFTVSYISNATKKTVANFVCRKGGLKIRITPPKPFYGDNLIRDFPDNMKDDIIRAAECKRLSNPTLCNPKCSMGYAFNLDGEYYEKCRSMAFLFNVTLENLCHIVTFIQMSLAV